MKMQFYVAAKLLSTTYGLLFSGYVAFVLTILAILLKSWQSLEFWILIFLCTRQISQGPCPIRLFLS